MKSLPGRKTDVKDAEWIAQLLRHGLLRASFIPNRTQRELRELVRYRRSIIEERARQHNRIQKVLEGANIKLGSVVSDIMGVSAKDMLRVIAKSGDAKLKGLHCYSLSQPAADTTFQRIMEFGRECMINFLIGVFAGSFFMLFIMSLMFAAKRGDMYQ